MAVVPAFTPVQHNLHVSRARLPLCGLLFPLKQYGKKVDSLGYQPLDPGLMSYVWCLAL